MESGRGKGKERGRTEGPPGAASPKKKKGVAGCQTGGFKAKHVKYAAGIKKRRSSGCKSPARHNIWGCEPS